MPRVRSRPLAAVLLLCLGLGPSLAAQQPASSRWWDEIDGVEALLRDGRWARAARRAEALRRDVVRESWREHDLGQVLAKVAFQAAVAHANLGDEEEALWQWHVAQAHERVVGRIRGGALLVERDLAPYGRAAELLPAHPLRLLGAVPAGEEEVEIRPLVDYEPVTVPPFEPLPLENKSVTRERVTPAVFEVFVDREGRLRQPVVKSDWTHPVILQWGFENLRRLPPFGPARIDGEPVGVLEELEIDLGAPARF